MQIDRGQQFTFSGIDDDDGLVPPDQCTITVLHLSYTGMVFFSVQFPQPDTEIGYSQLFLRDVEYLVNAGIWKDG